MAETKYYSPGAAMELETSVWPSSQVGTIGVRVNDDSSGGGVDTVPRTTAGITFDAVRKRHQATGVVAPTVPGEYTIFWDDGTTFASQPLVVSGSALLPLLGGGRATMAELITRVRLEIGDPSSASQQFSDVQIQDALDEHREFVRWAELDPLDSIAPTTGALTWVVFEAPGYGFWEADEALYSQTYVDITSQILTPERIAGRWTFTASQLPPVYITGKTYDLYRSCADLLQIYASALARRYDFSRGNQSYSRSQEREAMLELRKTFLARARVSTGSFVRGDEMGNRRGLIRGRY